MNPHMRLAHIRRPNAPRSPGATDQMSGGAIPGWPSGDPPSDTLTTATYCASGGIGLSTSSISPAVLERDCEVAFQNPTRIYRPKIHTAPDLTKSLVVLAASAW